jgi:uncharacterized protein YjiS (DUF1127 family)
MILFKIILRKLRAHMRYRKAISELSVLTDRELADLGITRCDIYTVASSSSVYTR